MEEVKYDEDTKVFIYKCPHCKEFIITDKNQLNCKIFRHGVHIKTLKQINSHAKKTVCDKLKKNNLIYGCGKPYEIKHIKGKYVADICKYK